MSQEPVPIADQEFVLRRIHKNHVQAGPPAIVSFLGFRPTPEDTNGLSVYRENLTSPADVAAQGRKPGEYFVVRLAVESLRNLGMTIQADEQETGPAGQALIPELSLEAYRQDKVKLREIQIRLAEIASQQIVIYPDP